MNEREPEAADESPSKTRERLEHEADAVRERLSVLSERRHRYAHAFDQVRDQAKRHPVLFIMTGIAVAAGIGTILYRRRAAARRTNVPTKIAQAISILLGGANAAAVPSRHSEPSLAKKSLARVGDAVLSAAIGEIGRRSASLLSRERT